MIRKLMSSILAVLAVGLAAGAAPEIHVDSATYEFGTVVEGFAIDHTFVLSNVGDETLIIDRVRATCGCTTTGMVTPVELAPGESTELHAVVSSNGFGGTSIAKPIYVYSNDPNYTVDSPGPDKLVLRITGDVLRFEPFHTTIEDLYLYSILLVDLRDEIAYGASHLVGAINVEPNALSKTLESLTLPHATVLIVYDATGATSYSIAQGLVSDGIQLARALEGGLAGWLASYWTRYLYPMPISPDYGTPTSAGANYTLNPVHLNSAFYVLIDLRSPEDFAAGHLAGATNIPLIEFSVASLDEWVGDLPSDAGIILYDQSGEASDDAAQTLIVAGYENAKSLLGGLDEWQRIYGDELIRTSTP